MTRKGLVFVSMLSGIFAAAAQAGDVSALELQARWARAVAQRTPLSVKFRWRQFNHIFQTERVADGVFYHNGQDRWTIRLNANFKEAAVSALQPSNPPRGRAEPYESYVVMCTDKLHLICYGDPGRCERGPWHPVSACEPENIAPSFSFADLSRNLSRLVRSQLEFQRQMPLLLPQSGDLSNHRAIATHHSNGDLWLKLTPNENSFSAAAYRQIDVVFRPHAKLPYAIRVIDADSHSARHFLFDEIHIGDDAVIPEDAFPADNDH